MFSYVARQAILDSKKNLYAYELLFREGEQNFFPDINPDEATSKILTNNHLDIGLEDITGGKLAFINFHQDTLQHRFPTSLDKNLVVIEVVETVQLTPELVQACINIKEMGYKLALDDFDFAPKWDVLLPYADIVKVDIVECDQTLMRSNIDRLKQAKIKLVAEKIETYEEFEEYKALGFDYFQGYFFARPEVVKQKSIPTSKLALIDLVCASAATDFNLARVNDIIERDVSLSYKLLRFINNPLINKSNKISSLRHALNYMGEIEVKKFIALVALANLGDSKTIELLHLSLMRAKFCELVGKARKLADNPPTGFLLGLFSLLDAILDIKMRTVVEKLPLGEQLKGALCGEKNELQSYLSLIKAYEVGYWQSITRDAQKLDIELAMTQGFYNEAIKWGHAMKQLIKD
ncbi:EAL domain-containing protein [Paraglaciecola sp. 25GB23A]|uniref:EAL and HDOD domain-containing protein n=1 Tax=Paraglaciecola sp. 25GB23A TaxID=3156068 RepID=UPI0032AFBC26